MNPDSPLILDPEALQQQLWNRCSDLRRQPFHAFLHAEGILQRLVREAVLQQILSAVQFAPEEQVGVIEQLWQGLDAPPPLNLEDNWLEAVDPQLRPQLIERLQELRRQKFLDITYAKDVDTYFLERRADLEQIVYGMIRLTNLGAAEELYLRLIDDNADFTELARLYSVGDERYTHGLVGPMSISQPHPSIRAALTPLEVGQIAAPLRIDPWILILRMEHRQPAQLNETVRQQLLQELFETDLQPIIQAQLERALLQPGPPQCTPDRDPKLLLQAALPMPPAASAASRVDPANRIPVDLGLDDPMSEDPDHGQHEEAANAVPTIDALIPASPTSNSTASEPAGSD